MNHDRPPLLLPSAPLIAALFLGAAPDLVLADGRLSGSVRNSDTGQFHK